MLSLQASEQKPFLSALGVTILIARILWSSWSSDRDFENNGTTLCFGFAIKKNSRLSSENISAKIIEKNHEVVKRMHSFSTYKLSAHHKNYTERHKTWSVHSRDLVNERKKTHQTAC